MNIEREKKRLLAIVARLEGKAETVRNAAELKVAPLVKKADLIRAQLALLEEHVA